MFIRHHTHSTHYNDHYDVDGNNAHKPAQTTVSMEQGIHGNGKSNSIQKTATSGQRDPDSDDGFTEAPSDTIPTAYTDRDDTIVRIHEPKAHEKLNNGLWLHILQFNDVRDLVRLSRTSHRFYQLATDDELWKKLYHYHFLSPGHSTFHPLRLGSSRREADVAQTGDQMRVFPRRSEANMMEEEEDHQGRPRQIDRFKSRLQQQHGYLDELRRDRRRLVSRRKLIPWCILCNMFGDFQQYCLTPMGFFCGLPLSLLLLCGKLTHKNAYSWEVALFPLLLTTAFMLTGFIQSLIIYRIGARRDAASISGALWINERHSLCGRYIQYLMVRRTSPMFIVAKFGSSAIVLGGLFLGVLLILLRVENVIDAGWSVVLIPLYVAIQLSPTVALSSRSPLAIGLCTMMFCTLPLTIALLFTALSFDGVLQWKAWEYLMPLVISFGIIWVVFVVLITLYTLNEADGDHHCLRAFCLIWLPSLGCFTLVLGLPVLQIVFFILRADTSSLDHLNYFEMLSPSIVGTLILCCGWWPIGCINLVYHCFQSTALYDDDGARPIYDSIDSELETLTADD